MVADRTLSVRKAVDARGNETGVEEELPPEESAGEIDEPFNPENIDVVTRVYDD